MPTIKSRIIDKKRYQILDQYVKKSDAIVARDGWKTHLNEHSKQHIIIKIEPHTEPNGNVIWEILARVETRL